MVGCHRLRPRKNLTQCPGLVDHYIILRHPEADWNRENRVNIKALFETLGLSLEGAAN